MMRHKVTVALLGAFITTTGVSPAAPLPGLKGRPYDEARAKIIKLGYLPVRFMRTEDGCLLDKACKRYPELIGCAPAEPANCRFAFKRPDGLNYAVITTRGEKTRRVFSVQTPSARERKSWPMIARR